MKKDNVIPHSVVDWDFTAGAHHELQAPIHVSPPTSLHMFWQAGNPLDTAVLCRIASTLVIADGEVRTWYRTSNRTRPGYLVFRNQHALDGADLDDCYFWALTGSWAYLYRRIAGVEVEIGHFSIVMENNTWYHWRTRYYTGKNLTGDDALVGELYLEVAGAWVQQGETLYDITDQWKDSGINRSGIGGRTDSAPHHYFDDTEIWGAV